ncbi:hypothetical protein RhiirC2_805467 [Rhizophagus irregularis]|uniref:Uncharacterized protein n=1 Tax=Rhizophagus irregularis TaxID=588596 RepID=A0A2N1KUC2_9GLOM|nr:hypothetical protein RhiirC2_805467 [Rhizophagus irregularis]
MYRREQYIPSIYDNPNNNYNQSKYGESNQEWDDPNNDHDDQSQGWDDLAQDERLSQYSNTNLNQDSRLTSPLQKSSNGITGFFGNPFSH